MPNKCHRECWAPTKTHEHRGRPPGVSAGTGKAAQALWANRKHAQAAYVSYESEKLLAPAYRYFSPALLGEGTDFSRYLSALASGLIIFDPGSKVMNASTDKSTVKARSQFRTSTQHLAALYEKFDPQAF